MHLNPYLNFNGTCEEAFKFYERHLGGKIVMLQTFGDTPMAGQMPDMAKKVVHARITIGDLLVMGSDAPPDNFQPPQGMMLALGVESPAEADRVFNALADGGQVRMALQQTFFSQRFGMLVDRFGIPWMINCDQAAA
jgi:PhnB protein